ncbi:MAG: sulfotransferase [Actinomycetota bacterium]|nr:sulfotransferase [Actinomycetota bacterium]
MGVGRSEPFFIVGCGRSGTTMLRLMFNAHPDVAIPPESQFIPTLVAAWPRMITREGVDADAIVRSIGRRLDHMGLDRDLVRDRLAVLRDRTPRAATECIFGLVTEAEGKPRWADKTPRHVEDMPTIAGVFPEARFIHIVRDGRDVALSFFERPFGPRNIWDAARHWGRTVGAGVRDAGSLDPERYREVRYERLIEAPDTVMKELCDFVGLEPREEMLRYFERAAARLSDGERGNHPNVVRPPTKGLRDWRIDMIQGDVEAFEAVAGPLLSELGYERRFPRPSRGVAARRFLEMRRRDARAGRIAVENAFNRRAPR